MRASLCVRVCVCLLWEHVARVYENANRQSFENTQRQPSQRTRTTSVVQSAYVQHGTTNQTRTYRTARPRRLGSRCVCILKPIVVCGSAEQNSLPVSTIAACADDTLRACQASRNKISTFINNICALGEKRACAAVSTATSQSAS